MDTENLDQLRTTYAEMNEDELAAVAADAYDLTDAAKAVLRAEISRRGMNIELKGNSSEHLDPMDPTEKPEPVATLWNAEEARRLLKVLSDAGIPFYLGRDNAETLDSFHGSFEHGVDLKVDVGDMKAASMLIENTRERQPSEVEDNVEDADEEENPSQFTVRCPKCHSEGVVLDGRESEPGVEREFDQKYDWHCDDCGYRWQDEGIEERL